MSENILMVLNLLCGVALFLYGMSSMGDGLKKVAGNKLELVLYKLTNSPAKGFLLGMAVTCVIQSSSAATVMVVGFVNSGMMKVTQAIGVILGANIGTSITGWIICLSYLDAGSGIASFLSSSTITAVVAIIGILLKMFSKKETGIHLGTIMLGFAVLMTGMSMMSSAVSPLRSNPVFLSAMTSLSNPILAMLFGVLFAAVLQSSSAAIGVLQALSTTGAISFQAAFPMIMGIGIGASAPVLLAAIGANRNGQRTSILYLLVAILGMLLASIVYYPLASILHLELASKVMAPFDVALVNTLFRAATMCCMLPFCKQIKKLLYLILPSTPAETEDMPAFELLEDRFLSNPVMAYEQSMQVMNDMALATQKALRKALNLLENYSSKEFNKVASLESNINKYEDKLGTYLIKQTGEGVSLEQGQIINKALQAINDFEDISDYALRIAEVAKSMDSKKLTFSLAAQDELTVICTAGLEMMDITTECFINNDASKIKRVFPMKELIDMNCSEIKKRHVLRLKSGECHMEEGIELNDLLANFQRIADHCANLALDVIKLDEKDFNLHRFLRKYQEETRSDYAELLHEYEIKYGI
jgi:phosphate:Na+ symporter